MRGKEMTDPTNDAAQEPASGNGSANANASSIDNDFDPARADAHDTTRDTSDDAAHGTAENPAAVPDNDSTPTEVFPHVGGHVDASAATPGWTSPETGNLSTGNLNTEATEQALTGFQFR